MMKWRKILVLALSVVCFLAAYRLSSVGLQRLPGSEGAGKIILLSSAAIAWLVSFSVGERKLGIAKGLGVPTVCLLVALWQGGVFSPPRGTVWVPSSPEVNFEIPENAVLFHFACGFTSTSSGGPIELDLPWPHVNLYPVGVPENRIRWDEFPSRPSIWDTYPRELSFNSYSKLLWVRLAIERDGRTVMEKRLENGEWSMSGESRFLWFEDVGEPYCDENILAKARVTMHDEKLQPRDILHRGETVVMEGLFLVPEGYENRTRIGDLVRAGTPWGEWIVSPAGDLAPVIGVMGLPDASVTVILEQWIGKNWQAKEKFMREWENFGPSYHTLLRWA